MRVMMAMTLTLTLTLMMMLLLLLLLVNMITNMKMNMKMNTKMKMKILCLSLATSIAWVYIEKWMKTQLYADQEVSLLLKLHRVKHDHKASSKLLLTSKYLLLRFLNHYRWALDPVANSRIWALGSSRSLWPAPAPFRGLLTQFGHRYPADGNPWSGSRSKTGLETPGNLDSLIWMTHIGPGPLADLQIVLAPRYSQVRIPSAKRRSNLV